MENWKKAVLAGSAGVAAILLLKGNRTGGFIFGGVALAAVEMLENELDAPVGSSTGEGNEPVGAS